MQLQGEVVPQARQDEQTLRRRTQRQMSEVLAVVLGAELSPSDGPAESRGAYEVKPAKV
jgi:hypothetical protein